MTYSTIATIAYDNDLRLRLAAITPDATQTGTVTLTNEAVSAAGHYLAAS